MLLSGIQARPELDPRLKHSGVTPLDKFSWLYLDLRQLAAGSSFDPSVLTETLDKQKNPTL
jgi:hypothetical protein